MLPSVGSLGAVTRWAAASKGLWGVVIAVTTAGVITGGTLVGAGLAARQTSVEAAAVATSQAAKPGAAAKANGNAQLGPPRAVGVGIVVSVGDNEIVVNRRQGGQGRVVLLPKAVIWKHGRRVTLKDVQPGESVFVFGRVNAQQRIVQARIVVVDPPLPLRARGGAPAVRSSPAGVHPL